MNLPKPTQLLDQFLRVGGLSWVINIFTVGRVEFKS